MKSILAYILARLREPGTYRWAMVLATAAGITIRPDLQESITAAGLAIAGLIGVVAPDAVPPVAPGGE